MAWMILAASMTEAAPTCRFMKGSVEAGAVVNAEDTTTGPCSPRRLQRKLRYDPAARVVRAAVDLVPGEELGRAYLPERPTVLPGDHISLVVMVGPVLVTRAVTALQAGRPGRRLFVRDYAGKVFKAPVLAETSR